MSIVAIDPGDLHVGFAAWSEKGGMHATELMAENTPGILKAALAESKIELVIIEAFVLYPGEAAALSYEPMRTSELIGALRYVCRERGIEVALQPASVKKPIRAQCGIRHLDYTNKSIHAEDAMLHLWYHLLRNGIVTGTPSHKGGRPKKKASVK